jgi:5-methylcytosine-specific restriction endonuclease McrA
MCGCGTCKTCRRRAARRRWRHRNRELVIAQKARYRERHREELAAKQREYAAANAERIRLQKLAYRERKRAETTAQRRAWKARNPEKTRMSARAYAHKRRGTPLTGDGREYVAVLERDVCAYCGAPAEVIDHIRPLALGGSGDWDNLTAACNRCNYAKNAKPLLGFLLDRVTA